LAAAFEALLEGRSQGRARTARTWAEDSGFARDSFGLAQFRMCSFEPLNLRGPGAAGLSGCSPPGASSISARQVAVHRRHDPWAWDGLMGGDCRGLLGRLFSWALAWPSITTSATCADLQDLDAPPPRFFFLIDDRTRPVPGEGKGNRRDRHHRNRRSDRQASPRDGPAGSATTFPSPRRSSCAPSNTRFGLKRRSTWPCHTLSRPRRGPRGRWRLRASSRG